LTVTRLHQHGRHRLFSQFIHTVNIPACLGMARVARIIPWSVTLNPISSSPTHAFDPTTPAVRVQRFTLVASCESSTLYPRRSVHQCVSLPSSKPEVQHFALPQATGSPFPSMEFFPIPLWCHQRASLGALNCPHCQVAGPCSSASIN
jgi:hypothetical protein